MVCLSFNFDFDGGIVMLFVVQLVDVGVFVEWYVVCFIYVVLSEIDIVIYEKLEFVSILVVLVYGFDGKFSK